MSTLHRPLLLALALCAALGCKESASPEVQVVPDPDAPLVAFEGPSAPIQIKVDDLGLHHVYAQDDLDLFYAQGYLEARDLLFALDLFRRQALGTAAALLGPDHLSGDIQSRTLGFPGLGERAVAALARSAPRDHNLLVAFTAGLNAYVREVNQGAAPLPGGYAGYATQVEPFTPAQLLAIGVRIQFSYSSTLEFDLLNTLVRRLSTDAAALPLYEPAAAAFIMERPLGLRRDPLAAGAQPAPARPWLPLDEAALPQALRALSRWREDLIIGDGSNGWVIGPEASANGRPILANDSHGGFTSPSQLYLIHLNSADAGGAFDVLGMGFMGIPGVQLGHNRHIAWGATTNYADLTDLWEVPVEGDEALLGGQRLPVRSRQELIQVRQPDGTLQPEEITVRWIDGHGVLLSDDLLPLPRSLFAQGALLLGWPGFEANDELRLFLDLDRAKDLFGFYAAIGHGKTGMQNFMAADKGGIAYRAYGQVPDRGPRDGRPAANLIMDGTNPRNLWGNRFLPDEQLPAIFGGPWLASANNDPWGHTADNDPLNDDFYYGSFYAPGFRAARLHDALGALTARGGVTLADNQALQLEQRSQLSPRLLPFLTEALDALDTDPALEPWRPRADELRAALARLRAWDGDATAQSAEALLFRLWVAWATRRLLADDLGLLFDPVDEAQAVTNIKLALLTLEQDLAALHEGRPREALVGALAEALDTLAARPALQTWGDLHRATFDTPNGPPLELVTGGDDTSLNVAQSSCWSGSQIADFCRSDIGAVFRYLVSFDEDGVPQMDFQWPEGNALTTEAWLEGRYERLPFLRADVEARTTATLTLPPR